MAGPTADDHPVDSANGASRGQRDSITAIPGPPQALANRDQEQGDADQAAAERDQLAAERDQFGAERDQLGAERDQAAADSDQAASDRDLAHGGDPNEHDLTRDLREHSARQRHQVATGRLDTATARDAVAHTRDLTALARDQAAMLRDRELATRDATRRRRGGTVGGIFLRAMARRSASSADRTAAVESRAQAAADREQAARDREQAARDRLQAQLDRDSLLQQLAIAETDQLTGTRTRAAGLADLDHEIDRALRTTKLLAVAYVDVVGLKAINDAQGHSAGDALLARAVRGIRDHLRSYDMIIRHGGDEFLCVMSGATIEIARRRFAAVQAALAEDAAPCEIRVGFAALEAADSATDLIERADAEMPTTRRR